MDAEPESALVRHLPCAALGAAVQTTQQRDALHRMLDAAPIARWGLGELNLVALAMFLAAGALFWAGTPWAWAAPIPLLLIGLLAWFYRDPPRKTPDDPSAFLASADGKVVEIEHVDHYDFLGGPATRIGVFLSLFDVHINRTAKNSSVVETHYHPGERRNALDPASATVNEFLWTGFEEENGRRHAVRQIAGLVARRIVCDLKPGDAVQAGERFGMIKFGSRTELIVPEGVEIVAKVGDRVKAGVSIVARISEP